VNLSPSPERQRRFTVPVGRVSKEAEELIRVTREALGIAIKMAKPGNTTGDIGHAVQKFVESYGFEVVKYLGGHGIGKELHEDPFVMNFGNPGDGELLEPGMVIAIEPMVAVGSGRVKQRSKACRQRGWKRQPD